MLSLTFQRQSALESQLTNLASTKVGEDPSRYAVEPEELLFALGKLLPFSPRDNERLGNEVFHRRVIGQATKSVATDGVTMRGD
jgi:hypothetical protein